MPPRRGDGAPRRPSLPGRASRRSRRAAVAAEGPQFPAVAGPRGDDPQSGGKPRRLGIPTAADRVVQASLKLVLEPTRGGFPAVFLRFPPGIAGLMMRWPRCVTRDASQVRDWVVEGDIKSFLTRSTTPPDGPGASSRRGQTALGLVKAFLKAASSPRRPAGLTVPRNSAGGTSRRCWPRGVVGAR